MGSKAVLSKKRGSGRGSWKAVPLGDPRLDKALVLLRRLSFRDLEAVTPVLAKYALPEAERTIDFQSVAEAIDFMVTLIDLNSDARNMDVSGLACWLDNHGTAAERTEALLALIPVGRRAFERWNNADEAVASLKGKKQ